MADIEDAYGPVLAPLADLKKEQEILNSLDLKVRSVDEAVNPDHPYLHPLVPLKSAVETLQAQIAAADRSQKAALKVKLTKPKMAYEDACKTLIDAMKERTKHVKRAIKELEKLQEERDAREQEVRAAADREILHLREAAADLRRILGDPDEAKRYFTVVENTEIEENEFNLNLPRYVDTFEPEPVLSLEVAVKQLHEATNAAAKAQTELKQLLDALQGAPV